MLKSNVKIVIEAQLEDYWATEDQFVEMTDDDIIELVQEDLYALLEDAKFTVIRGKQPPPTPGSTIIK